MSEKIEKQNPQKTGPGNQKIIQFKNKFEENMSKLQGGSDASCKNSKGGKENCYSFLSQKSLKDLAGSSNTVLNVHPNNLMGSNLVPSSNKRQSSDKYMAASHQNKQGNQHPPSQQNALETYNKLMQLMNDRLGGGSKGSNSRGKSNEK